MSPRRSPDEAAATRDNLIDAALEVFAERGYAAAQLEEIAGRADVTRGALYHHFSNKADLYFAVLGERWPAAMEPLWQTLRAGTGPSRARVQAYVAAFLTAVERNPVVRSLLKMGMAVDPSLPELQSGMRQKARAWQNLVDMLAAVIATDHKPAAARQAAVAVVAFMHGASLVAMVAPALVSPARDATRLANACVNGAFA